MVLKTKFDPNGVKIAFFFKKSQKLPSSWGLCPQNPSVICFCTYCSIKEWTPTKLVLRALDHINPKLIGKIEHHKARANELRYANVLAIFFE